MLFANHNVVLRQIASRYVVLPAEASREASNGAPKTPLRPPRVRRTAGDPAVESAAHTPEVVPFLSLFGALKRFQTGGPSRSMPEAMPRTLSSLSAAITWFGINALGGRLLSFAVCAPSMQRLVRLEASSDDAPHLRPKRCSMVVGSHRRILDGVVQKSSGYDMWRTTVLLQKCARPTQGARCRESVHPCGTVRREPPPRTFEPR